MSIINLRKNESAAPTEPEASIRIPADVPDDLREFYGITEPRRPSDGWAGEVRRRAWFRAVAQAESQVPEPEHERPAARARRQTKIVDIATSLVDRIVEENYDEILAQAKHDVRLSEARTAHKRAEDKAAQKVAHRAANTCPVCGQYDTHRNGPVDTRRVDPQRSNLPSAESRWLRSCVTCQTVAIAEYAEYLASDQLAGARTRRDAVRAALDL